MELKIKRENVIVPIVSALLIVIISNLKIDWYFKTIMFPFFIILVSSTILVMKNDNINKKAFYFRGKRLYTLFAESLYRKGEKFYGTDSAKGQRKKDRGNRCERDSVDFRGVLRVCQPGKPSDHGKRD